MSSQNMATKSVATTVPSPAAAQPPSTAGQNDGHWRRSGGGSGSLGAGAASRASSSPRNNQALRKQHKGRRPKLGIEDSTVEAAVIRSTSSRKGQTSITHLMNIHLPPRPQSNSIHHNGRHGGYKRPTWGLGSGYHAVDKARYIHANYRFIVDPRAGYCTHAVDPDIHLDWANVLQILASAQSQATSCPICLSIPVAPRMAKCGHIFCLPCMIRYMHSSDEAQSVPERKSRWKSCPICWDSIYMAEMRPVRWFQGQEGDAPQKGADVVLRLIMRKPGSVIALPQDEARSSPPPSDVPWYFAAEVTDYARIMKGSEEYMLSSFDDEMEKIRQQHQEDLLLFGDESQWTKKAIFTIREMKEKCRGLGNPPNISKTSRGHLDKSLWPIVDNDLYKRTTQNRDESHESKHSDQRALETPFFFYQALLHYYLSSLDIRILKAAFGDYSAFPATILPRVEHVSTGHTVDDDLRKRMKYLGHLPSGCEVGFLECDWTDVVSAKVLEGFAGEIDRRRRKNRDKEAREEKERLRAEKEEDDKRWALARRKKPRDASPIGFVRGTKIEDLNHFALGSSATSSSPPLGSSSRQHGSAFTSLASPSTSPTAPRTVWGTSALAQSSLPEESTQPEATENDGWLQDWERDLLQEEHLEVQMQSTSLGETEALQASSSGTSRKKKNKKITLMSTNARRAA